MKTHFLCNGGCTFDEASGPCGYIQGTNDDFDWQLVQIHDPYQQTPDLLQGSYMMVNSSQHAPGQKAHFILQSVSENDTHCIQFSYFLHSRDGRSPGSLNVFISVKNGPVGNSVWNVSGSHGLQWLQAELAVNIFWPNEYQVIFEVVVSTEQRGYIGIDDLLILNYPCYKTPHFQMLQEVETNSEQNAIFNCMVVGKMAKDQRLLLQTEYRNFTSPAAVLQYFSLWYFQATFRVNKVTKPDQGLYRCVIQSNRGSGVSNFAELIVKEPPVPIAPPQLIHSGSTYLIVQLNANAISGDGPVIRKEIEYQVTSGSMREFVVVNNPKYKMQNLDPDTEYKIRVLLTRPGEGGFGDPGPQLICKTKCAKPIRAPENLTFSEIKPRQITLRWESLVHNIIRCHTYSIYVCPRYTLKVDYNLELRHCIKTDPMVTEFTVKNLLPYKKIYVHLILINSVGRKESKDFIFQTEEDVPGAIPAESIRGVPLENMILLKWGEPLEPNGIIIQYEIHYQCVKTTNPAVIVPGYEKTRLTSKNETHCIFEDLEPGTTYRFSVRASTRKGFGQSVFTEITTNISAPSFDYGSMPPPLHETNTTITVQLKAARAQGASISVYQVVVEEDKICKVKQETRTPECFPFPIRHEEAAIKGVPHYYSAEIPPSSLPKPIPFTVGDNNTYNGYWNAPLDPKKDYCIYFQAMSKFKEETMMSCIRIAKKAAYKKHSVETGLILGICVGILSVFILGATFVFFKKRITRGSVIRVNESA